MITKSRVVLALLMLALAVAPAAALKGDILPAKGKNILTWSPPEQEAGYRRIEDVFDTHLIKRGGRVHPLPHAMGGPDLSKLTVTQGGVTYTVDSMMAANHMSGLLVLKDGKIVLERYALGRTEKDRWVSFSVAKSVTSTLIGAAIKDGYIGSVDDQMVKYIPELAGTAYDGVSIRNLITMTSGVKWNEGYLDPNSDVTALGNPLPHEPGQNGVLVYMSKLQRAAAPGTRFLYNTGDTDLAGMILTRATHKTMAEYLSEKIWKPYGMEKDANWMLDGFDHEHGGCCISMTLRDYGRFGQFMLEGGGGILPDGWVHTATTNQQAAPPVSGRGGTPYGFFWWIQPNQNTYEAQGIKGQLIHVDPIQQIVIVENSAIPNVGGGGGGKGAFINAVVAALTTKL